MVSAPLAPALDVSPVSSIFLEGWRRRGVDRLLPFQERVLAHSGLLRGESVMIVAPTSAGKTRLAEAALARALDRGQKAIYLAPTRALAEEKFAEFERWIAPRFRVLCATRDRPESDPRVIAGKFDLLVAVYEKMNQFMLAAPELMAFTGAVAIDEIQMLGEPRRGATLDLLVTKILLSPYRPQLVALASELAEPEAIADWLGCESIVDSERPRALREGILDFTTGIFHYRDTAAREDGVESFDSPERLAALAERAAEGWLGPDEAARSADAALLGAAASLASRGEPLIVFAPTRHLSRLWARQLAAAGFGGAAARLTLPRLADEESGRARQMMEFCLERGVAFHNADLSPVLREHVEAAFNDGELRVLVSTSTLGLGVNLAARNVLHFPWRIAGDSGGGRCAHAPLGRARFANQGGRAARLGLGQGEGRSMLVARSKEELERMWEAFIVQPAEPIGPPLADAPPAVAVLDFLTGGIRRNTASIAAALGSTFSARRAPACETELKDVVEQGIAAASAEGLIRPTAAPGLWEIAPLGQAIARSGIAIDTARRFGEALRNGFMGEGHEAARARAIDPAALFFVCGLTEEGRRGSVGLGGPSRLLARSIAAMLAGKPAPFARGAHESASAEVRAYYVAMIFEDWIAGMPAPQIEEKYNLFSATLARAAGEIAWLLGGFAAVASALGAPAAWVEGVRRLAERAAWGVPESALPLARLRVPGLTRGKLLSLAREGWTEPAAIAELEPETLIEIVGQDAAGELQAAARRAAIEHVPLSALELRAPSPAPFSATEITHEIAGSASRSASSRKTTQPLLEIDLTSPGIVRARGREVPLPPLCFELLAALAERPGEVVTRAALYVRLWPEGDGPEEQQLDGHRRNLLKRLRPALGPRAPRLAEVVRGIGFRLALDAEEVALRR